MKKTYKIAASFILAGFILVACTVPVQQEEEIGYMIKGLAATEVTNLKSKLAEISDIDPSQLSVHQVIYEQEENGSESPSEYTEVIMVLPEANHDAALDKKAILAGVFNFQSLEILPIEETVERTMFETALNKFDLKLRSDIPDSVVARRIDQFIHENSSVEGTSNVFTDENGVRYVELVIENSLNAMDGLNIEYGSNANANLQLKRGIESLHVDLGVVRKDSISMNSFEVQELRKEELQKMKELKENLEKDN
ncbi:MAG: hypothetical protein RLN81_14170 [Balneolaceae bacterium]